MNLTLRLSLTALTLCTTACAVLVPTELQTSENMLGTHTALTQQFHSVLYYPDEIALNFPGYIVGIEKVPVDKATKNRDRDILTAPIPGNDVSAADLKDELVQQKIMTLTHIMKGTGAVNCALYSAYVSSQPDNLAQCAGFIRSTKQPYAAGWDALSKFREHLENDINARAEQQDNYTHILIVTMGWNTNQEEAVRNFNAIVGNIKTASNGQFNPLFIGVTWPSLWESGIIDPLYKLASYPNKASDADEVGISWLGALLHHTLKDLAELDTVVVGHSFGARATSMATCAGPTITQDGSAIARNNVELLISLQGAYSLNRFSPQEGIESLHYDGCRTAGHVLLTASLHDLAMDTGFWAPFVGDESTFQQTCHSAEPQKFSCQKVGQRGWHTFDTREQRFVYVDADDLISYNAYKSGGGAHSDIYRIEMGRFLWSAISTFTSTGLQPAAP